MTDKSQDYVEGYKKCMDDLEDTMNKSIFKHNGATNLIDCLSVLNDIIHFTHRKQLRAQQWEDNNVEFFVGTR